MKKIVILTILAMTLVACGKAPDGDKPVISSTITL